MREERLALPRKERAQEPNLETRPDGEQLVSPVLLLQRQAGNRAVGSLLAREPGKDDGQAVSTTITLPDPVGVLPVTSFQLGSANTVSVAVPRSAKDPELMKMAHEGKFLGTVKLSTRGATFVIADAVLANASASASASGDTIMLEIVGASVMPEDKDKPKGAPDSASYDLEAGASP